MNKLTQNDIQEILILAKQHWPKSKIARKFHVQHSAIIYHINKNKRVVVRCKLKQSFTGVGELPVVEYEPKTYEEYRYEEDMRILKKQSECKHQECIETIRCKCCGKVTYEDIL